MFLFTPFGRTAIAYTNPFGCGFHEPTAPLTGSSEAAYGAGVSPNPRNSPPARSRLPSGSSAHTTPSGPGSHAVARPVVRSSAARLLRATPPMLEKSPPTHTSVSTAPNVRTDA